MTTIGDAQNQPLLDDSEGSDAVAESDPSQSARETVRAEETDERNPRALALTANDATGDFGANDDSDELETEPSTAQTLAAPEARNDPGMNLEIEKASKTEAPSAAPPSLTDDFAVCFSGGGYRAAGFHLGTLIALDELRLRTSIRTLSTISGGTILGTAYALSIVNGTPFQDFQKGFRQALLDTNVVAAASDRFERGDEASPCTFPSLIRAAASVYAEEQFVGTARLGDLRNHLEKHRFPRANSPLPDQLVFSATEFTNGNAFRFQTARTGSPYIGVNSKLHIPKDYTDHIRLADITAASSCFPGAFEPLDVVDDFDWKTEEIREGVRDELKKQMERKTSRSDDLSGERMNPPFSLPLSLMDGGIYDNQGLNGVRTVYARRSMETAGKTLGWVLVSDSTPDPQIEPVYRSPRSPEWHPGQGLSIKRLLQIGQGIAVFAGISGLSSLLGVLWYLRDSVPWWIRLLLLIPVLLSLGVACGTWWLRQKREWLETYVEKETGVDPMDLITSLHFYDLVLLLRERGESLLSLTTNVFTKRVRALVQTVSIVDDDYRDRTAQNLIYSIAANPESSFFDDHDSLRPSPHLVALSQRAQAVPTTLWFKEGDAGESEINDLIECGTVTTYFNVLRFLIQKFPDEYNDPQTRPGALYKKALNLWESANSKN